MRFLIAASVTPSRAATSLSVTLPSVTASSPRQSCRRRHGSRAGGRTYSTTTCGTGAEIRHYPWVSAARIAKALCPGPMPRAPGVLDRGYADFRECILTSSWVNKGKRRAGASGESKNPEPLPLSSTKPALEKRPLLDASSYSVWHHGLSGEGKGFSMDHQGPMRWYNPRLEDFEWREAPKSEEEALSLLEGSPYCPTCMDTYREWRELGAGIAVALIRAGEAAKEEPTKA